MVVNREDYVELLQKEMKSSSSYEESDHDLTDKIGMALSLMTLNST